MIDFIIPSSRLLACQLRSATQTADNQEGQQRKSQDAGYYWDHDRFRRHWKMRPSEISARWGFPPLKITCWIHQNHRSLVLRNGVRRRGSGRFQLHLVWHYCGRWSWKEINAMKYCRFRQDHIFATNRPDKWSESCYSEQTNYGERLNYIYEGDVTGFTCECGR